MPRRKSVREEPLAEPILMLPSPRPHKHVHDIDPYEAPAGAVPIRTTPAPGKRKDTKADLEARQLAKMEQKGRALRYSAYLEAMQRNSGDQAQALAEVYGMHIDEVRKCQIELHDDVCTGLGTTELGKMLERHDLSLAARVALLSKHAYSPIPAVSLKAIDMAQELEGARGDIGSFESYLRLVKEQSA